MCSLGVGVPPILLPVAAGFQVTVGLLFDKKLYIDLRGFVFSIGYRMNLAG